MIGSIAALVAPGALVEVVPISLSFALGGLALLVLAPSWGDAPMAWVADVTMVAVMRFVGIAYLVLALLAML